MISCKTRVLLACWLLPVLLPVALTGCRRAAKIDLHQSFAPPSQREMTLKSPWSFAAAGPERQRYLLAFPRPGAEKGVRDFLVYIDAPDERGRLAVDPQAADGARGFLIQTVGRLKGKTAFASGTVRVREVWFSPHLLRIDLDVRCADETYITGTAYVERIPHEVQAFERRYAADIGRLATTQPALTEERETADRPVFAP